MKKLTSFILGGALSLLATAASAQQIAVATSNPGSIYHSIGTAIASHPDDDLTFMDAIPDVIRGTEVTFVSALVAERASGIHLAAIHKAAQVIHDVAHSWPAGRTAGCQSPRA